MTILEYLLLGGFSVASIYAIYRLFIGWRNSSLPHTSVESAINNRSNNVSNTEIGTASTGGRWHSREIVKREEL